MKVSEVVANPGRQVLREDYRSKNRMPPAPIEVCWLQMQGTQLIQTFRAHTRKFIQQLRERLTRNFAQVSGAIKRLKRFGFAKLKNDPSPGYPVRAVTVNQMGDNQEHTPSVSTFVGGGPSLGKVTEKSVERGRGAREERNGMVQVLFHDDPQFAGGNFSDTAILAVLRGGDS
jgi:hypothetical protein